MSGVSESSTAGDGPWPAVLMFELPDGSIRERPPADGRAYRVKVRDGMLGAFDELCRSGKFYRLCRDGGSAVAAQSWRATLQLPAAPTYVTPDDAEKAFRRLAFDAHPDRGGTHDQMVELMLAISAARRDLTMREMV